ncbi:MAG: sulfotransferase [Vicinamibacterales bacterium]
MLEAGGLPVWTDGIRAADDQNPNGYYELERIKDLDKPIDKRWLREGRGRAVKVISSLLEHLPAGNHYQVIFMNRDLTEVLQSQGKMLAQRGEGHDHARDAALEAAYAAHLRQIASLLAHDTRFTAIRVAYADVVADPAAVATRIQAFLGTDLDTERMAAAVDGRLYHNRLTPGA